MPRSGSARSQEFSRPGLGLNRCCFSSSLMTSPIAMLADDIVLWSPRTDTQLNCSLILHLWSTLIGLRCGLTRESPVRQVQVAFCSCSWDREIRVLDSCEALLQAPGD
jgi:hypothetical protein